MLRRAIPIAATMALTAGGALFAGSPVEAAAPASAPNTTPTSFALAAAGYGTRVKGGNIPAGSDRTAFQAIGCTNLAGLNKTNSEASVNLGNIHLNGVSTRVWTTKKGSRVSSWSRNSIAKVDLANTVVSDLYLRGVSSTSHAWHGATGFHSTVRTNIVSIVLNVGGVKTTFPVPAPGDTLNVPDVANITLNKGVTRSGTHSALARVDAVRLNVIATNTTVFLAHTRALIQDGVRSALFHGSAYSTKVSALNGRVTSGPTPFILMPCAGTRGKVISKSIVHASLGGLLAAQTLRVSQRGYYNHGNPDAFERASVAHVKLTNSLRVALVVARAHVVKNSHGYVKDIKGTSTGRIFYHNRRLRIPASGVLRISGVAKIESNLVKRTAHGIEVTALRVTLLSGNVAVVNIAHAKVGLSPSGL